MGFVLWCKRIGSRDCKWIRLTVYSTVEEQSEKDNTEIELTDLYFVNFFRAKMRTERMNKNKSEVGKLRIHMPLKIQIFVLLNL